MKQLIKLTLLLFCIGTCFNANSQILIDQGIAANGLLCFPLHNKKNTYLYLPKQARLSLNKDNIPEFSFLRYIIEKPTENNTKSIVNADGGAILNFLVLYDTPKDLIASAQLTLKEKLENDSIKIQGPVLFTKGKYTLVSSILNPESGTKKRQIIETGVAPIFENSKIPLSFNLEPIKSKLLLESLKMSTPDVSLLFELSFSGLTESYEAELEVDWSQIESSKTFEAGGSAYFVGADISLGFDKLRKEQAIKLTSTGNDKSMESLVQTAYSKLLELLFEPVEPAQVSEDQRGGLEDALSALISPNGILGSRKTIGFGMNVGYQYKEHHSTGKSKMVFNGRSNVSRNHYITFNVGNLYKNYGNNKNIFKDVPLWDPAFQQRDVYVGIDGNIEQEFDKMLNSVTVKLKKAHKNGDETIKEVLLTKGTYKEASGKIVMKYLNHGDLNQEEWLQYEYQTIWKFIGGGTHFTPWMPGSSAMINLFTPFKKRKVEISGGFTALLKEKVRAVSVHISYDFFGEQKTENRTFFPKGNSTLKPFQITLPKDKEEIDYSITWFLKDGTQKQIKGTDKYGLIFIDELPKSENNEN